MKEKIYIILLRLRLVSPKIYEILVPRMIKSLFNIWEWRLKGSPLPPPHELKQSVLIDFAISHNLKIFVETGTFKGAMVEAVLDYFNQLYSVELSKPLFNEAKKKFKNQKKVRLYQGDSKKRLKEIVLILKEPALFWLDAHYSGEGTAEGDEWSPVLEEVKIISKSKMVGHVVLIDDARGFTGKSSATLKQIEKSASKKGYKTIFSVEDDIIRIYWE